MFRSVILNDGLHFCQLNSLVLKVAWFIALFHLHIYSLSDTKPLRIRGDDRRILGFCLWDFAKLRQFVERDGYYFFNGLLSTTLPISCNTPSSLGTTRTYSRQKIL